MSKQKQWEVERHMRRHWEQLQRARQKGHRDAEGRAMSSWRPGELVRRERSRRRELDERRRIQQGNEEMIARLYGILDPTPAASSSTPLKASKTGTQKQSRPGQRDREEAEYLRRRGYRARVLREVRESRDRAVREEAAEMQRRVQQVEARVPGPRKLLQEYQTLQSTHKKMHDFQVPDTAFHLHLPRGGGSPVTSRRPQSTSGVRRNYRDGNDSVDDKCEIEDNFEGNPRLPKWYRQARQDARGMGVSASAPALSFTKFSRRTAPSPPKASSGRKHGTSINSDRGKSRPQSATAASRLGKGNMKQRPHSAYRVADRPEKQSDYMSLGDEGQDDDDDGPDWLVYSEKEVREVLLGTSGSLSKQKHDMQLDSHGRKASVRSDELPNQVDDQVPPVLTEEELQQAARHGFLGDLLTENDQRWAALLADSACRVRCSLLSELPPCRVNMPVPACPAQCQTPSSPSRSSQNHHRGSFSVTLFDLGLVCPAGLLQAQQLPNSPCHNNDTLLASSAGILVECRLLDEVNGQARKQAEPSADTVIHSMFLSLARLQSACESGGGGCESTTTASLARKLLRLRATSRQRRLFSPLGGPQGLGAEGLEQLCNFVADNLRVQVALGLNQNCEDESHDESSKRRSQALSRMPGHERTVVTLSIAGAN